MQQEARSRDEHCHSSSALHSSFPRVSTLGATSQGGYWQLMEGREAEQAPSSVRDVWDQKRASMYMSNRHCFWG